MMSGICGDDGPPGGAGRCVRFAPLAVQLSLRDMASRGVSFAGLKRPAYPQKPLTRQGKNRATIAQNDFRDDAIYGCQSDVC